MYKYVPYHMYKYVQIPNMQYFRYLDQLKSFLGWINLLFTFSERNQDMNYLTDNKLSEFKISKILEHLGLTYWISPRKRVNISP